MVYDCSRVTLLPCSAWHYIRPMSLSDEELERYARHIVLREIGGVGQAKIRAARVLIVGAGGLRKPLCPLSGRSGRSARLASWTR